MNPSLWKMLRGLLTTPSTVAGVKPVPGGKMVISGEAKVGSPWTPAAFQGDEYAQEFKIDELFHFAITPSTVGNTRHLGVSATTGPYTVWDKLDELGIEATHDQVAEIHRQCKAVAAARQAQLPDSVVAGIARTVTGQEGTAG